MPIANVNGVDLYYEVYGEGPPILGIHGTPSSAVLWVDAAKELGNCGKCIIYDRRGFFRSQRPEPFETVDLSDHVNDAAALLDALGSTPAVVIGRSTGGQIALELAHRFPDSVKALVLLEPAVFTVDPRAAAWADRLRRGVQRAAVENPSAASEAVFREALGDLAWDTFPEQLRELFAAASPAVLAEMRGQGLDLSEQPRHFSAEELAGIRQPTLIVSAEDSPDVLRRVNDRLTHELPHAEKVLVAGGHLIDPAHPAVLGFVDRVLTTGHVARSSETLITRFPAWLLLIVNGHVPVCWFAPVEANPIRDHSVSPGVRTRSRQSALRRSLRLGPGRRLRGGRREPAARGSLLAVGFALR